MLPTTDTPLIRLENFFPGGQVHAKCEFVALSGSFKIRGAVHLLERLARQGQTRRLVVPSMGNTALGAAVGARAYGFNVTGVVPASLTRAKDEKLTALGVDLVKVEGGGAALLATAQRVAHEQGGYFMHPHLDTLWTDGYQAIAAEVLRDLPGCRSLLFPVGGGGLLMGLTAYCQTHAATVRLIGCEAYNFPDPSCVRDAQHGGGFSHPICDAPIVSHSRPGGGTGSRRAVGMGGRTHRRIGRAYLRCPDWGQYRPGGFPPPDKPMSGRQQSYPAKCQGPHRGPVPTPARAAI